LWLEDTNFLDYENFMEWRDEIEDDISWDQIEFWETWHDVGCDRLTRELYGQEKLLYNKAQNKMSAEHEEIRTAVEEKAVIMSL
jgi:hypothetical protein